MRKVYRVTPGWYECGCHEDKICFTGDCEVPEDMFGELVGKQVKVTIEDMEEENRPVNSYVHLKEPYYQALKKPVLMPV